MVNTYAVQSGGCRFESLWGFGFFLKGAHCEVDYSGKTRRERLKSALYLRLKKRKTFFLEKKLEIFEKKFFRKMSHSAEKCKRGTLFDL